MMIRYKTHNPRSVIAYLVLVVAVALALLGVMAGSSKAAAGDTTRVSVSSSGAQGNEWSDSPSISSDGRFVAFDSYASNLVHGDTNSTTDIFVHNRRTGTTQRVSVSSSGKQANAMSFYPSISSDGRFVAFSSTATNLVKGDTNGRRDIFVRDRQKGITRRVSMSSSGAQANRGTSWRPTISSDGRFVAFTSASSNLVPGDTNDRMDVFVRDRRSGTTERVSVNNLGKQANRGTDNFSSEVSSDGRFVTFTSASTNLVRGDANDQMDVFVRDLQEDTTERVSLSSSGSETNRRSYYPSISSDGRFVAFESLATNLVEDDTNGRSDVFVRDLQEGSTERVSVSSSGQQSNSTSYYPSISSDGRFVAFLSGPLVEGYTHGGLYVRDRQMGTTQLASISSSGEQANSWSDEASISSDGHFVAFSSPAKNLVEGDTNPDTDVFVHEF